MAIGCNSANDIVSLTDAEATALDIKLQGFAGVATWSINRDTNHRYEIFWPNINCKNSNSDIEWILSP